jgi:chromosome segregation ATPase
MKGPKKSILSQVRERIAPTQQAGAGSPPSSSGDPSPAPSGDPASSPGATSTGDTDDRVAVLSLSQVGEIIAARQACRALFGREAGLLLGQNIRVLLKGGLDNEVGRFLLRYQTGESAGGTSLLNVIALRKDGTEFPARVTTQTWSWDKTVAKKGDTSSRNWTAIFRDLSENPDPPSPPAAAPSPEGQAVEAPAAISVAPPRPSAGLSPDAAADQNSQDDRAAVPQPEKLVLKKERSMPERLEPVTPLAAPAAPKDLEGVAVELSRRFEEQLAALRQEREELKSKLAAEQSTAAQFKHRVQQLESRTPGVPGDPEQAKAEAEKLGLAQVELRTQLDAAREAAGLAEAVLKEEVARRTKLEEQLKALGSGQDQRRAEPSRGPDPELSSLRRERDELKRKLNAQQQAAAEATRRAGDLEGHFGTATSEFERVKSELVGLTVARDRAQAEWRQQLAEAQAVKSSLEKSLGEALARHTSHEAELAKLRRENTELTSKLAGEQLEAAQSQHLPGGAKGRPGRNITDSKRANAELEKLNAERQRAESQWKEQLDAASATKARLEASLAEALEHRSRFEQEAAKLRQERDDLRAKFVAELQAAAQSQQLAAEGKGQSSRNAADTKRANAELEKLSAEHKRAETQWREKLEAANTLKARLESTLRETLERHKQLEQDAAKLRQERDDFQARLTAEQQAAAQFKQREQEFEAQSRKFTGDLDQAKAEAERRECTHSELRGQLEAAKQAVDSANTALKEEAARRQKLEEQLQTLERSQKQKQTERNGRLDQELASLRQEREELKRKLEAQQKAATEATKRVEELAGRISQDAEESARSKTELEVQNAERDRMREDMRIELAGAHAARTRLESSLGEAMERGNRFESELAELRREQEDLKSKLASEQRTSAELRLRAEHAEKESAGAGEAALKKEIARREQLEERLKTLSSGLKQEQAERKKRFDKELSSLRTERDALDAKLASEQKEAAEAARRAKELESRLNQNASEVERAKTELEQLSAERERSETVWREQLDTAFIAKKELAGAWAGAVEQNKRLEEELAKLRQEQEELNSKLTAEQQAASQSKNRASDVEGLLNRNATESERVREELEKQNAEMERMQAEWRGQLEAAEAGKASLEASLEEARERSKCFEAEVGTLRHEREGLQGQLTAELQAAVESRRRANDAENQLNQSASELERANAELQQLSARFEQSESNWRKQLEAAQARKLESKKSSGNEVAALRQERDDLRAKLAAELQTAADSKRSADEAEVQLSQRAEEFERVNAELQQLSAKFEQSESNWRKQLEAAQARRTEPARSSGDGAAALRQERDDLRAKLSAELHAAAESRRQADEAELRRNESEAELERLSAELNKQSANVELLESRWRKQSEAVQAQKTESQKILAAADDCNRRLEKELTELRLKLDKLASKPKSDAPPPARPIQHSTPAERRAAQCPPVIERRQPESEDAGWAYPAQIQNYQFDFAKSPPARKTRESREPARRRRQP